MSMQIRRRVKPLRLFSSTLCFLMTFSFLIYGAVADRMTVGAEVLAAAEMTVTPPSAEEPADAPELEPERAEEISDGEEVFEDFFYENDLPMAADIYDGLFLREKAVIPSGELRIAETDLSKSPAIGQVFLKNHTELALRPEEYMGEEIPALAGPFSPSEPLVLIYHSHGTESYAAEGAVSYAKKDLPRSDDITENVVAVGAELAAVLNGKGIPTLHCEIMHDKDSYNNAYQYSKKTLLSYLEEYPSIRYAFDVHRDALLNTETVYKTLTYDGSEPVAQIMFVVGTDRADGGNGWRSNFALAVNTQCCLGRRLENICRPICVRTCSFWQEYCPGGLLIEVGTCVNTLSEAKAAARRLGEALSAVILENCG